jgi:hypothetical protein
VSTNGSFRAVCRASHEFTYLIPTPHDARLEASALKVEIPRFGDEVSFHVVDDFRWPQGLQNISVTRDLCQSTQILRDESEG